MLVLVIEFSGDIKTKSQKFKSLFAKFCKNESYVVSQSFLFHVFFHFDDVSVIFSNIS